MAGEIKIPIELELTKINASLSSLEQFSKLAQKQLDDVSKSAQKTSDSTAILGSSLAKFGIYGAAIGVAVEAFSKLNEALTKPIEAASKFEEQVVSLNTALALSGNYSEETSKSLLDYAQSIQETTKVSDDAVLSSAALIEQITQLGGSELRKATQAAIDLSAALNIDLDSASRLVAKATEGNVEAFKRFGIQIQKGKTDAETFANTLETLGRFQGAAEAKANTFSGSLTKLGNLFEDIIKPIGFAVIKNESLISAFNSLSTILKDLEPIIAQFAKAIGDSISTKSQVALYALGALVDGLKEFDSSITYIGQGLVKLAAKTGLFSDKFLDDTLLGNKAFAERAQAFDKVSNGITKAIGALDALDSKIQSTKTKSFFQDLSDNSDGIAKKIDEKLIKSIEELQKKLKDAGKTQTEIINSELLERQKLITEAAREGVIKATEAAELSRLASIDAEKKLIEEKKRLNEKALEEMRKARERIEQLSSGDIKQIGTQIQISASLDAKASAALSASILNALLEGSKGASKAITGALGLVADSFIPGIGGAVAQIFEVLAQGPDKVRELIEGFVKAIPDVIEAILFSLSDLPEILINAALSLVTTLAERLPDIIFNALGSLLDGLIGILDHIPDIIEKLISNIDVFILKLAERLPQLITKLGELLPGAVVKLAQAMPDVALSLATELIKNAPTIAYELAKAVVEAFINFIIGGFESIINGFIDILNKLPLVDIKHVHLPRVKLAEGGTIPGGFPNDTLNAGLSSGELVVPRQDVTALREFINRQKENDNSQNLLDVLRSIDSKMGKDPVIVNIGGKQLISEIRENIKAGRVIA